MKKSEFERMLTRAFWGIETKHSFKRGEIAYTHNGCTVSYRNTTTEVTLNYEIGVEPWFVIANANDPEQKSTLEWLLVEKGLQKAPTPVEAFKSRTLAENELESVLARKNDLLMEHGADLLKGDFSIIPTLNARSEKYAAECKRYIDTHKIK